MFSRVRALFSRRINDPVWLYEQFHTEGKTVDEIASLLNVPTSSVSCKLRRFGITHDELNGVYTGRFHVIAKGAFMFALRFGIRHINRCIDEIYDKISSRNGRIFKKLVADMERADRDTAGSSGRFVGLSRKQLYITLAKFIVCLYEYDTYYAERMDWILKEVLAHKDEFYLDSQSDPENWHPNRDVATFMRYLSCRNTEYGEDFYVIKMSDQISETET